ncbi:hypothetical protein FACS1894170_06920 [Planctomycetales bacterium]|nr:hypothetical protein FACS1894170_06920 [Planctomycetales bacterium]
MTRRGVAVVRNVAVFYALHSVLYTLLLAAPVENVLTETEHPWGTFGNGSYTVTQTKITTYSADAPVRSTQTIKTVLVSVEDDGVTLQVNESLQLGEKTINKEPHTIRSDFWQEPILQDVKISTGKPLKLVIGKKTVPCETRIYEQKVQGGIKTTTVWWNRYFFPYILRTERVLRTTTDVSKEKSAGEIVRQSVTVVVDVSGSSSRRKYQLRTTEQSGKITKRVDTLCSNTIPGGIGYSITTETDETGKIVRKSQTNIQEYKVSTR